MYHAAKEAKLKEFEEKFTLMVKPQSFNNSREADEKITS